MSCRIVHFSDSHLGYTDQYSLTNCGIQMRELDFYKSFKAVVDKIIEIKPDAVVHTGDLFHRPSPANRPLVECLTQIKRLSFEKIPFIVIAGNHSTPRSNLTSPILGALESIDGVYPFFREKYETIELNGIMFHALPHCNDDHVFNEELQKMVPVQNKINIALLHTSAGKQYMMEEYGERVLGKEYISILNSFDYIALGHWHGFQKVSIFKNAWYSGSTERLSDSEYSQRKGFIFAEIDNNSTEVSFNEIETRPWYKKEVKDCGSKTAQAVENELFMLAKEIEPHSLVNITLSDLRAEQGGLISNTRIAEIITECMTLNIRRVVKGGSNSHNVDNSSGLSIEALFDEYTGKELENDPSRDDIISLGRKYFLQYEENKK